MNNASQRQIGFFGIWLCDALNPTLSDRLLAFYAATSRSGRAIRHYVPIPLPKHLGLRGLPLAEPSMIVHVHTHSIAVTILV